MLTKEEFQNRIAMGAVLDGATGSWLRAHGMPKGCSTELWVLDHPDILTKLQRGYARAGADIIYAPTFQAQPIVLASYGREKDTEEINRSLVALSRRAAPGCLIAGDLTTLAGSCDSFDPKCFDLLVENYRRQIRGLMDGGADLLVGETLMYPQEAEAILTAAELEGAGAAMYSFTMQPDGSLFSGAEAGPVLRELEKAGACAVGFNCVPADDMTAGLVLKLRRFTKLPLICKPNAGVPVINAQGVAEYDLNPEGFAKVMAACRTAGAMLLGGCCGTTPEHLAALTGIPSEA